MLLKSKYEGILHGEQRAIKNVSKVLDKKIIIQELKGTTENEKGFEIEDWQDIATVWASKNNLSGKEYYRAKQYNEEKTVKFEIRYQKLLADLESTRHRILHDGKIYNITFVDNFQYRNEWLVFKALESGICQG